jgi:hypothetical protein
MSPPPKAPQPQPVFTRLCPPKDRQKAIDESYDLCRSTFAESTPDSLPTRTELLQVLGKIQEHLKPFTSAILHA